MHLKPGFMTCSWCMQRCYIITCTCRSIHFYIQQVSGEHFVGSALHQIWFRTARINKLIDERVVVDWEFNSNLFRQLNYHTTFNFCVKHIQPPYDKFVRSCFVLLWAFYWCYCKSLNWVCPIQLSYACYFFKKEVDSSSSSFF